MKIAEKNIDGILRLLKELQSEGKTHSIHLLTSNYGTECYGFMPISTLINQVEKYGILEYTGYRDGIWDTKENDIWANKNAYCGNFYDIYAEARNRGYIS